MLLFKQGVLIRGVAPEIVEATRVVEQVFERNGYALVVTSSSDGWHGFSSLHYIGHGRDFRSKRLIIISAAGATIEIGGDRISVTEIGQEVEPSTATKKRLATEAREALAPLGDFDFILEQLGKTQEHYHMEYQPKRDAGTLRA